MARSMSASASSDDSSRREQSYQQLPPWERRDITRVPYLGRSSSGPDRTEHAITSPMTAQTSAQHQQNTRAENGAHRQTASDSRVTTNAAFQTVPWDNTAAQLSAPPPRQIEAPYHTPLWTPSGPQTAPLKHQYAVAPRAPPTPPDSLNTSPPGSGLMGTMSSRERTPSASRKRNHKRKETHGHEEQPSATSGIGAKFKSAFKGVFKREPVHEGDFEHIGDRHWTEEDY